MAFSKRYGRFELSHEDIQQNPDACRAVLGSCIVVRAEMILYKNAVEYVAMCDDFEEVEPGMEPPWYDMEIAETEDGVEINWTKK